MSMLTSALEVSHYIKGAKQGECSKSVTLQI